MKKVVTILAVLVIATASQAAVTALHDGGTPTGGLPGFTTYIVTLNSSADMTAFALSLDADPGSALNQLEAGGPGTTMFTNFNFIFPNPDQDTQFMLGSGDVINGSPATEDLVSLTGDFAFPNGSGFIASSINLIQVCMADGDVSVLTGTVVDANLESSAINLVIPEPASLALLSMGGISMLIRRKR